MSAAGVRLFSGEEVSVSLGYALGLRTDQTPPIRASNRNTAGKRKTKWVPEKGNNSGDKEEKASPAEAMTQIQRRAGGMKPWRLRISWRPALDKWETAEADRQNVLETRAEK